MEDKIIFYPLYCFECNGGIKSGIILIAANNEKEAYNALLNSFYGKHYQISFDKIANDIFYKSTTELKEPIFVFKHFIENQ